MYWELILKDLLILGGCLLIIVYLVRNEITAGENQSDYSIKIRVAPKDILALTNQRLIEKEQLAEAGTSGRG